MVGYLGVCSHHVPDSRSRARRALHLGIFSEVLAFPLFFLGTYPLEVVRRKYYQVPEFHRPAKLPSPDVGRAPETKQRGLPR